MKYVFLNDNILSFYGILWAIFFLEIAVRFACLGFEPFPESYPLMHGRFYRTIKNARLRRGKTKFFLLHRGIRNNKFGKVKNFQVLFALRFFLIKL